MIGVTRSHIEPEYLKLAAENGIKESTFRNRVHQHGWSQRKAATTPVQRPGSGPWRQRPGPARAATAEEVEAMEAKGIKYSVWSGDQLDSHVSSLGPDTGLEMHLNRGKQTAITAPQLKKSKFRRYYKKGGEF